MKKLVAALAICSVISTSAAASAQTNNGKRPNSRPGPLLSASLHPRFQSGRREATRDGAAQPKPEQRRSWVGRHPALTGAIAGFGAGCALVYLTADEDAIIAREGPALFFGGVGAGIGALIGWGVSRARDDRPSTSRP
jgi:hypothetical protein